MICRTLVADELVHIAFESQLLLALSGARSGWVRTVGRTVHRTFLTVVALVVWCTHRRLLRHAGYDLRTFAHMCRAQHAFYLDPVSVMELQSGHR